jgi:chromatin segregation and condensation protein Rec8/ScpA/Scc1 (kleisin family)
MKAKGAFLLLISFLALVSFNEYRQTGRTPMEETIKIAPAEQIAPKESDSSMRLSVIQERRHELAQLKTSEDARDYLVSLEQQIRDWEGFARLKGERASAEDRETFSALLELYAEASMQLFEIQEFEFETSQL